MNDEQILHIINAPKKITKKPKKEFQIVNGSYRSDFEVTLIENDKIKLSVHLRKNVKFSEHFSVVLSYYCEELQRNIILLRYNGVHGYHKNRIIDDKDFASFHIHRATSEAISKGYNAECWAYETKEYTTLEEAVVKFWEDIKIQDDIITYFKNCKIVQLSMVKAAEAK